MGATPSRNPALARNTQEAERNPQEVGKKSNSFGPFYLGGNRCQQNPSGPWEQADKQSDRRGREERRQTADVKRTNYLTGPRHCQTIVFTESPRVQQCGKRVHECRIQASDGWLSPSDGRWQPLLRLLTTALGGNTKRFRDSAEFRGKPAKQHLATSSQLRSIHQSLVKSPYTG